MFTLRGWPAPWQSAHPKVDEQPAPAPIPRGWDTTVTDRCIASADRSRPLLSDEAYGPVWKAAEARRDEGDEPMVWLDGGLAGAS